MRLKYLKILISFGVLLLTLSFFYSHHKEIASLKDIPLRFLILLFSLHIIQVLLNAVNFKLNIDITGTKAKASEWIGLRLIGQFGNYISILRGGSVASLAYIKYRYGHSLKKLFAIFMVNTVVMTYAVLSFIPAILIYYTFKVSFPIILIITLPPILFIYTCLSKSLIKLQSINFINRNVRATQSLSLIHNHTKTWNKVILVNWVTILISSYSFYIGFMAINIEIDYLTCIVFVVLCTLTNIISLTPANIGIQEIIIAYVTSNLTNIPFENAIIVASLIRAINIAISFIGSVLFSKLFLKDWNQISK